MGTRESADSFARKCAASGQMSSACSRRGGISMGVQLLEWRARGNFDWIYIIGWRSSHS